MIGAIYPTCGAGALTPGGSACPCYKGGFSWDVQNSDSLSFIHSVRFMDVWETFVGYGRSWRKDVCYRQGTHKRSPKRHLFSKNHSNDENPSCIELDNLAAGFIGIENLCKKGMMAE